MTYTDLVDNINSYYKVTSFGMCHDMPCMCFHILAIVLRVRDAISEFEVARFVCGVCFECYLP
jgi:hypothetical protein